MLMFTECKQHCDFLVVGLQTDPSIDRPEKNAPIMSVRERHIILSSIRFIDQIVEYTTERELYELLQKNELGIDVRIIGADWRGKPFTGHDLPIPVVCNSRGHGFSTSELRNRVYTAEQHRLHTQE